MGISSATFASIGSIGGETGNDLPRVRMSCGLRRRSESTVTRIDPAPPNLTHSRRTMPTSDAVIALSRDERHGADCPYSRKRQIGTGARCAAAEEATDDQETLKRRVPLVLAQAESQDRQAAQPWYVQDSRSGRGARARRAVLQASWLTAEVRSASRMSNCACGRHSPAAG